MPLFKYYIIVSKAYSVSKKSGDKAVAYLASSIITKKKFKNTVPTLSRPR